MSRGSKTHEALAALLAARAQQQLTSVEWEAAAAALAAETGTRIEWRTHDELGAFQIWLSEVGAALQSINMPMEQWQRTFPYNFPADFYAGIQPADAAKRANDHYWTQQEDARPDLFNNRPNAGERLERTRASRRAGLVSVPGEHGSESQPRFVVSAPTYEPGDFVKVEFAGEAGMPGEWMWVRVSRCDVEKKIVFGTLDSEPLNDYRGEVALGSELAVSYSQIREHKKPTEFTKQ